MKNPEFNPKKAITLNLSDVEKLVNDFRNAKDLSRIEYLFGDNDLWLVINKDNEGWK